MTKATRNPQGLLRMHDHNIVLMILPIIILFFSVSSVSGAVPVISSFTSNTNGSSQYIQVNSGTVITFSVIASGATSYNWYVDNRLNITQHSSSFVMTMTGYHSIAIAAQNTDGNSTKQYKTITINQVTASVTVAPLNDSGYIIFESQLENPDLVSLIQYSALPYTNLLYGTFYLLLWTLVFGMIWIRTDKVTVPAILGLIIGVFIIPTLPAPYMIFGVLWIIGGVLAAVFIFAKEKR